MLCNDFAVISEYERSEGYLAISEKTNVCFVKGEKIYKVRIEHRTTVRYDVGWSIAHVNCCMSSLQWCLCEWFSLYLYVSLFASWIILKVRDGFAWKWPNVGLGPTHRSLTFEAELVPHADPHFWRDSLPSRGKAKLDTSCNFSKSVSNWSLKKWDN